jgi:hypothetical protein
MRFVAVEDSQINLTSVNANTGEADTSVDLKHSKDGITWTQYDFTPIPLAAGETLYLKGNNENGFSYMDLETGGGRVCTFGHPTSGDSGTTGLFICLGNIMSLLYGDDFEDKTTIPSVGCFYRLFYNCRGLLTAPELPATTLTEYCYSWMFASCDGMIPDADLESIPEFPITSPKLPATTLTDYCYSYMFASTPLNRITMLATDISASDCLDFWVAYLPPSGTFVKHPDMDSLPTGIDGIPEGWRVIDYDFKN